MTRTPIRALLIEDNAEDAALIRAHFEVGALVPMAVETVSSLREGVERLDREEFDVLVLDLGLPDSAGLDAIRSVVEKAPRLPVVALTGDGDTQLGIEGIKLGAQDYLVKGSISSNDLSRAIRYAIERKNLENLLCDQRDLLEQTVQVRTHEVTSAGRRLDKLLQSSPAVLFSLGLKGKPRIDYVSPNIRDILEFQPEDFLGGIEKWIGHFHPDDQPLVESDLKQLLRGETPTMDYRLRDRQGGYRWIHGLIRVFSDSAGCPSEGVGYVVDVTCQKEFQAERVRLVTAIEQARDIVVVADTDGRALYVNPAFERATGYPREEVIGIRTRFLKSGKHDASFYADLWNTLTSGKVWEGRFFNKRKDGSIYPEDATISPIHDDTGRLTHYVKVAQDVTDKLNTEKQLLQSQRMEAVGQLAGGVAHDFNNLLQVITGYTEMAMAQPGIDAGGLELLKQVHEASQKAATLTRQLLAFSRRQVLQPVVFDLNVAISDLLKMLRRLIGEHIFLNVRSGSNLKAIHADPGQIEQIIMNLAVNARDAMPDGGTITIQTENVTLDEAFCQAHPWAREGEYVLLTFSDNGSGIPPEAKDHIFEPFFTTKEPGKGTGLGLATVYGIVKQHNGHIHVYSEPGNGAAFKIYLPVAVGQISERKKKEILPIQGGGETILIAEDEKNVRDLERMILERAGYKVLLATNGAEAVQRFVGSEEKIDLVLLDLIMPGVEGKSACEALLEKNPNLRLIFCSGYNPDTLNPNPILDGRFEFLSKPFSPNDLLRKIRSALDTPTNNPVDEALANQG